MFAAVLLAILAVAATGIWLLRQNVLGSFADYAVNIELDRLTELSSDLARRYRQHGNWAFVPADATDRRNWIAAELIRLQDARLAREGALRPGGGSDIPVAAPADAGASSGAVAGEAALAEEA
ncbi:hypothetical protein E4L96_16505, partial [Massilia arenosa]